MASALIEWHDLDGYARGVVDGRDKYLIQAVAFEGFSGYELLKPTSDGDLQLGYYRRVSTAKQIAEDKERARSDRGERSRPERFERVTAHEAPDEPMLYDQIRPHDRVTIVDRFGQQRTGRVVMRGPAGWVLNMGGQHGTPAIATPENVVRVRSAREVDETAPWPRRNERPAAREDAGPQGALDWKQRGDDWYAKTFGGAVYILSPDGEDGFHAYYEHGGKRQDLGAHTTLGGAMAAARAHQPAMSRAAEAGGGHLHSQKQPPEMPPEVRGHWQTTYKHQLPTKWSLERLRWNHTLYRVDAWVGRNLPEGSPRPDIFAVDARSPKEAERIVLDGWLREKYIGDWTFEAEVTEWPIDDGVPRMIPASSFSFSSEAGERVPVLHEDDPEVAVASVTKTETVTVAVANEDFSTVAQAEQYAYTEGFRFIAKHGKRYHVYKRRAVGKKGYERREMYHRRGKWHISGDRKVVSRLGEGARAIKVSQTAGTIRREEQAPAAPEAPVEVMVQEARRRVVHVSLPEKSLTKDQQDKADRAYEEGLSAGDALGNQMTTDPDGQADIRRMHRTNELRGWTKRTAENESEREDRGRYWQIGFMEGLRRTIDAWSKHNIKRYDSMASEAGGKLTLAQAKAELRPLGLVIISQDGEYRVNFRRGDEESAYYTTDLDDAVATGKDMAKRRAGERRISRRKPRKMAREDSKRRNLDSFTSGYAVAALWSSTDNSRDDGGDPLDDNYSVDDIASDTLEQMRRDCAKFQRDNEKDLDKAYKADVFVDGRRYNAHSAGFDFWLTRQGHGAGFWDRGLGAVGDRLTEASKKYGTFDLYVQDGKVHGEPLKWKGVNESRESRPAASEASEPAKEEPAGVGCAPCEAASGEASKRREKLVVKLDSEKDARKLRDLLNDTTKGYNDRMGDTVHTSAPHADVVKALAKLGIVGVIDTEARESTKKSKEDMSEPLQGGCVAIVERTPDCIPTGVRMETPRDVYDFMAPRYAKLGGEHFFVLLVSNQGELLGNPIEVAKGQPDRVAVDIEQVIAAAITGAAAGARGFLVSHGHPSGGEFARPSQSDKRLTTDIAASAKIACPSTEFVDHVIVCAPAKSGVGSYYSFDEGKVVKVRSKS